VVGDAGGNGFALDRSAIGNRRFPRLPEVRFWGDDFKLVALCDVTLGRSGEGYRQLFTCLSELSQRESELSPIQKGLIFLPV
jgi:hypothetical protein